LSFTIKSEFETKKEVAFEFGPEKLDDYMNRAVDDLRGRIEIDGFRKGKAPKDLIRTRFHEEMKDLALERLIKESYESVLSEKKWQPVSEAKVKDLKTEGNITFTVEIETIPDFVLAPYQQLDLVKRRPSVDDRLVDERIDQLRERHAELVSTTRPAQIDDLLVIDYQVHDGEQQIEAQEKIMLEIGDRRNNEDLNRALVGMSKDESKEFLITADDRMLKYRVRVWDVKEKRRPLLSDEFARRFECSDLGELKKKVQDTLKHEADDAAREELLEQISQYLIERHTFAVPESLVKEEYQKMLERQSLVESEELWGRFGKIALDRVRLQFVLKRIADQAGISASDEEVDSMIQVQAALLQADYDTLRERVGDSGAREHLVDIIRREKALNFVLEKANVIEQGLIKSPWEAKK